MTHFQCIKSGFYANLCDDLFLYGDAFAVTSDAEDYGDRPYNSATDTLILRVCSASREHEGPVNFYLRTWSHWFDELRATEVGGGKIWTPNSTLIASPGQWRWLGYKGEVT